MEFTVFWKTMICFSTIVAWLNVGYFLVKLWWFLLQKDICYNWKTVFGIFLGPFTALFLFGRLFWGMMPDM